jgi:transcriptional regulator with XRE-family HTH domain
MKNIYDNIKTLRKERKISQEDMAIALDMFQANYGKLERGITELTLSRLYKIAEILGVEIEVILGISKPIKTSPPPEADFEKMKKEIADLKLRIRSLESHNGLLMDEVEQYELLIFDNNLELSWTNFNTMIYIVDVFNGLMHLFFEKQKNIELKDQEMLEYTNEEIKNGFIQMMQLSNNSSMIDLIYKNKKLLKSAIIQEDGKIDIRLFESEFDELVKNYKYEVESQTLNTPQ